jgi:hypothetical protein
MTVSLLPKVYLKYKQKPYSGRPPGTGNTLQPIKAW